jgi:hypothetical protein
MYMTCFQNLHFSTICLYFPSNISLTFHLRIHTFSVTLKMASLSVYPGLGLRIADFVNPQVLGATNPDAMFGFAHGECIHEEL